jgi:hypothetical protein
MGSSGSWRTNVAVVAGAVMTLVPSLTATAATRPPAWRQVVTATLSERQGAGLAYDPASKSLLLFGGDNSNNPQQDTWTWNGRTWTRLNLRTSPPSRTNAAMAYDPDLGGIVLFGGDAHITSSYLSDTWLFRKGTWSPVSTPAHPSGRYQPGFTYDATRHQLLLFGGETFTGTAQDTWAFDATGWHQLHPNHAPNARYGAALSYHPGTRQDVLFGGMGDTGAGTFGYLGDTWTWTGSDWAQAPTIIAPSARWAPVVAQASPAQLILFGGYSDSRTPNVTHKTLQGLTDTWGWDGSQWTQLRPQASPPGRFQATMAYDPALGAPVLVAGCCNPAGGFLDDTWSWQTSPGAGGSPTWVRHQRASAPDPRVGATMVYDRAGRDLLLFGGFGGDGFLGDTWTGTGATWSRPVLTTSPPARYGAVATYDEARGAVVLFGGQGASGNSCALTAPPLNPNHLCEDTWSWSGGAWSKPLLVSHPSWRALSAMAYDPASRQTILFGGFGDQADLGDTWSWSGSAWTELSPAHSPSPRHGAVMAHDPASGQLLLFGGEGYGPLGPQYFNDVWQWSAGDWHLLAATSAPTPRYAAGMAFDAALGGLVLFGGCDGRGGALCGIKSDAWLWTGSAWQQLAIPSVPASRYLADLVDLPGVGLVLADGQGADGILSDLDVLH